MDKAFPTIRFWHDVRRTPHLARFVKRLKNDGLKPSSIRHCLEPISLTGKYFAREYEDFGYRPLYVWGLAPEDETEPAKKYLTGQQLEQAIKVAEDTGNDIALLALILGGWSGMKLVEICKLKQRDFDFKAGTVAVGKSGAKNKYRRRVIPLPAFVQEAVKGILYRQSVVDMEGSLVNVSIGLSDRIHQTISRPIHRLFKQAGLHGHAVVAVVRTQISTAGARITSRVPLQLNGAFASLMDVNMNLRPSRWQFQNGDSLRK